MKKMIILTVASFFVVGIGSAVILTSPGEAGWSDFKKKLKEKEEEAKEKAAKEAAAIKKEAAKEAPSIKKGLKEAAKVGGEVAIVGAEAAVGAPIMLPND
jgi:hypothetical protein